MKIRARQPAKWRYLTALSLALVVVSTGASAHGLEHRHDSLVNPSRVDLGASTMGRAALVFQEESSTAMRVTMATIQPGYPLLRAAAAESLWIWKDWNVGLGFSAVEVSWRLDIDDELDDYIWGAIPLSLVVGTTFGRKETISPGSTYSAPYRYITYDSALYGLVVATPLSFASKYSSEDFVPSGRVAIGYEKCINAPMLGIGVEVGYQARWYLEADVVEGTFYAVVTLHLLLLWFG